MGLLKDDAVELPADMPPCPTEWVSEMPPGCRFWADFDEGPRRPACRSGPISAHIAAQFWDWGGGLGTRGLLHSYLTRRQLRFWYQQEVCTYCGRGLGQPCVGRRVKSGQLVGAAEVDYTHMKRGKLVDRLVYNGRIPRDVFPDWLAWFTGAVGEDPHALFVLLAWLRGPDFAKQYLTDWAPVPEWIPPT